MKELVFPDINIDNFERWTGDVSPLQCIDIKDETHNVKSFTFKSKKDSWFQFYPGQHTTLFLNIGGKDVMRTYTIASSPTRPYTITITNKRMKAGVVTNWMHDNLKVGDCIDALDIGGSFSIALDKPKSKVLLLSGGSGITPMLSMSRYFFDLTIDVDIVFIHHAQSENDLIAKDELDYFESSQINFKSHYVCDTASESWDGATGFMSSKMLSDLAPDFAEREIYCCGPEPYMQNVKKILNSHDYDMKLYHQESFDIESSTAQNNMAVSVELPEYKVSESEINEYNVTLSNSGEVLPCGSNTSILVSIQKQGITVPFACSQGLCGTCRTKMLEGTVDMDAQGGLLKSHEKEGYILTCCSYPTSDIVLDL